MATSWPISIDSFGTVTSSELLGTANTAGLTHSALHNLEVSALAAVETSMQQWANGAITQTNSFSGQNTFTVGVNASQTGMSGAFVGATAGNPLTTAGYSAGDFAIDTTNNSIWGFSGSVWSQVGSSSGNIEMTAALTAPSGWLMCDGTAYSRATYATLFNAITIQIIGTITSTTTITVASTTNMGLGMPISGTNINSGTTITGLTPTQITVNPAMSASSGATSIVVAPYGVGDGSTTFNVPDLNNANSFPRGGGVLGVTGGATTTVHNHAFTTTHSHDLQNHIHGSAAHSHSLSDSGGAAAIPTLLNTIIYRANTLSSWTATDHVAISGAPVGDTSGNTGGIALRGSTDSTTPGNTGTPSTNSTSSISPGTSDNQTVSTLPPYLNVNFIIKI